MINTIPLIKTLRGTFPGAEITVLAENTNAEIIKHENYIDRVLVYKRCTGIYGSRIINIRRTLGGADYDLAIGVKGGFSSFLATASLLSGAKYRLGYVTNKWRPMNLFYNLPVHPIDFSTQHQVDACMNLLKSIGVKEEITNISLNIPPGSKDAAAAFLSAKGLKPKERMVVFNISNNREKSTWRADNFVKLGKYLIDKYYCKCIITGVSSDQERASVICDEIGNGAYLYKTAQAMDFAAISSMSNLLVTGDGGASHIGAAAGTLVITLFGEANPVIWRPYGRRHIIFRWPDCKANSITVESVISVIESNEHISVALNLHGPD
jgi:ADP-heptose:LPS heptosyltransferase